MARKNNKKAALRKKRQQKAKTPPKSQGDATNPTTISSPEPENNQKEVTVETSTTASEQAPEPVHETVSSEASQAASMRSGAPVHVTAQDIPAPRAQDIPTNSGAKQSSILANNGTLPQGTPNSRRSSSTAAALRLYATPAKQSNSSINLSNPAPDVVDEVNKYLSPSTNDLKLQGGDISRDIYKWTNEHPVGSVGPNGNTPSHSQQATVPHSPMRTQGLFPDIPSSHRKRSMSFSALSVNSSILNRGVALGPDGTQGYGSTGTTGNPVVMTHEEIRAPGGFRRSYILQQRRGKNMAAPNFFTRNFIEFLTLYGHFAGEDLSDSESEDEEGLSDLESGIHIEQQEQVVESDEETAQLLTSTVSRRGGVAAKHKSSTFKAVLLLLKSFVGTGVLFLPKAFHNGGWGFSSLCLLSCAIVSYYCFILLINTKTKIGVNGYGEMGEMLYGAPMKFAILFSIALSQIGFSAAYTVFTATNLKAFVENVFQLHPDRIGLAAYIILQALVFIPLSLTRNIAKLSGTALIADAFILLGLVYVYYYASSHVVHYGVSQSMIFFNKTDWSLFIGTAIFTFEGIGLLIPIQESMRHPEKFQGSLSGVMVIVTVIFISCGLVCYCAFGADVETVVLLNFPQDSPYTLTVQLLYALAILLSTPLQLFPAIRILEHWTFPANASGKHNPKVKWLKNYFRSFIVILAATLAWVGANDLDKFVSLVGSLACIPLIYIHPPLLHYRATLNDHTVMTPGKRLKLALDIALFVFGFGVMCYTSWQTIVLWVK